MNIEARFWRHVNKDGANGCWLWKGSLNRGYGRFRLDRLIYAHRFSWEINLGPVPDELMVLHKCDVRNCVNPAHLFLGSNADNMADMMAKGRNRQPFGENHKLARLTELQVRYIRKRTDNDHKIAKELAVSVGTVRHARCGITWKHVDAAL